ncbi:MAG: hypothetical protein SGPRY_003376 [Prymnesium sp.]
MSVRIVTPQISWHAREPVLSVDVSPQGVVATGGSDGEVHIWSVNKESLRADEIVSFVQDLTGHPKVKAFAALVRVGSVACPKQCSRAQPVNVVRFSPNGETLATAGDDGLIMLWQQRTRDAEPIWVNIGALRGHCADIYDLCWSPDAEGLFSGGVDGSSIVWNVNKSKQHQVFHDHNNFVQGVTWDPQGTYLLSLSCDRTACVYGSTKPAKAGQPRDFTLFKILSKRTQAAPASSIVDAEATESVREMDGDCLEEEMETDSIISPVGDATKSEADPGDPVGTHEKDPKASSRESESKRQDAKEVKCRLFLDDNAGTFFRRPAWSPDGSFVLLPCGQIVELPTSTAKSPGSTETVKEKDGASKPTTFVLSRYALNAPCAHLPGPDKPVVATRCCPKLFELSESSGDVDSWMDLPYRVVWAVATTDSIILYDSQHRQPLLSVSNIHLAAISDIAWLPTGDGEFPVQIRLVLNEIFRVSAILHRHLKNDKAALAAESAVRLQVNEEAQTSVPAAEVSAGTLPESEPSDREPASESNAPHPVHVDIAAQNDESQETKQEKKKPRRVTPIFVQPL